MADEYPEELATFPIDHRVKPYSPSMLESATRGGVQGLSVSGSDEIEGVYGAVRDPKGYFKANERRIKKEEAQKLKDQAYLSTPEFEAEIQELIDAGASHKQMSAWVDQKSAVANKEIDDPHMATWRQYQQEAEDRNERAKKANPWTYGISQGLGSIPPALLTGGASRAIPAVANLGKLGQGVVNTGLGTAEGFLEGFLGSDKTGMDALDDAKTGAMIGTAAGTLPAFGVGLGELGKKTWRGTSALLGGHKLKTVKDAMGNKYGAPGKALSEDDLADAATSAMKKLQTGQVRPQNKEAKRALSTTKDIPLTRIKKFLDDAVEDADVGSKVPEIVKGKPAKYQLGKMVDKGTPDFEKMTLKIDDPQVAALRKNMLSQLERRAKKGRLSEKDLKSILDLSARKTNYKIRGAPDEPVMNKARVSMNKRFNKELKTRNAVYKDLMDRPGGVREKTKVLTELEKDLGLERKARGYDITNKTVPKIASIVKADEEGAGKLMKSRKLMKRLEEWGGDKDLSEKFSGAATTRKLNAEREMSGWGVAGRGGARAAAAYALTGIGVPPMATIAAFAAGEVALGVSRKHGRKVANKMIDIGKSKGPKAMADFIEKYDPDVSRGIYRTMIGGGNEMVQSGEAGEQFEPFLQRFGP